MRLRHDIAGCAIELLVCGGLLLGLSGCSQEEPLVADPGVSPFSPASPDPKLASKQPEAPSKKDLGTATAKPASKDRAGADPGADTPIDARFGTNDVERQLRSALRTAQKGDLATAGEMLDKVLAIEPIHREALHGRAIIFLDEAHRLKSPEEKTAAIDKAIALVESLQHAYDAPKANEKELISRTYYTKFRVLFDRGKIDEAVAALRKVSESGVDAFARVDIDESLAALRNSPQYKKAHQADDEDRLARAHKHGGPAQPLAVDALRLHPLRPRGQESRARRLQGQGRPRRLLGYLVRPVPRVDPLSDQSL